jgi:hypothetical protein
MGFQAAIFDELTPLYPDSVTADGCIEYTVAGCNGTYAGAHILLVGLAPGQPVTVEVKGANRSFKLFELKSVPVEVNCGAKLRTEYLKDDINENVIRRAPFMVYEVLDPIYNIFTPPFAHAALAFKTAIEYCREKREHIWEITITQGDTAEILTLKVEEYPIDVPKANKDTFKYVNWFVYDQMAIDFNCPKWSERYFYIFEQYCRAAVFSRQNMISIPVTEIFENTENNRVVLNGKRLERIIGTARRAGISLFNGGALACREAYLNDDETYASMDHSKINHPEEIAQQYKIQAFEVFDNCPTARVGNTGQELPGKDGENTLKAMAEQLNTFITKNDLNDIWYQCVMDEPNVALEPVYRKICGIVKSAMPGIPIMEPTLSGSPLEETMDIWCPSLDQYEQNKEFYDTRVTFGERIWVYACLTPAANYLNRLLDMERLRAVWLGWAPLVYPDIEGFLHWGGNYRIPGGPYRRQAGNFSENVLEFHPKHAMFLPAGDCAIFYPGEGEPLISIRSEAHRIGFEDLYLLTLLKEKSPDKVLPLVHKVFRKFNEFEKDVTAYRAVRKELLESL